MSWILLAAGAQFINAFVALLDKYIVSDENGFPKPFVYAFYTCLISGTWIFIFFLGLLPHGFLPFSIPSLARVEAPNLEIVALSFLAAYTFFLALVSMFNAFKQSDASDVVPVVGAVSALSSFGLGYYFFGAELSAGFTWGIALLAIGTFLVSRFRFSSKIAMLSIHAGLFFALHYVAIKGLFNITSFDNAFFWSRIAFVVFALSMLLIPAYFELIKTQTKSTKRSAGLLILANKVMAGIGTILVLKATDLGDVAVVQALGGLQFVFILILGILFGGNKFKVCKEESCRTDEVIQKAIFVAIISVGFLVLFK